METPQHDAMKRRDFLSTVACGAVGVAAGTTALHGEESSVRKPNVIFAFSDEHRWHSMSLSGMPGLQTPNMVQMAEQGVSFTNCISNYPVCSPYRAILMTGRWPYQQGVIDNAIKLKPREMTLGKAFKGAGYTTGYVGKWHLGGARAEPYGFDLSLVWSGTNDHWQSRYHPKEGKPVATTEYNATLMTDQALEFIDDNRQRPFFLMLSWNPPHSNFTDPPEEKTALYPDQALIPYRPNLRARKARNAEIRQKREQRHWAMHQGYHAHVSAIDDELGRVMRKLDELGIANDTLLIYSSDHGSMLGSHGVGGKRQPHEESIKTPFLARWPGKVPAGTCSEALLGAIDVMPTVCGLAKVPVPASCEGHDLSQTVLGGTGPQPESQFIMHISKEHASGGQKHPAPLFRGVTTGRYTYAVYPDRPWCLFDNREDPYQQTNLIDDPAHADTRKAMRAMLADWLKKSRDPFTIPAEKG